MLVGAGGRRPPILGGHQKADRFCRSGTSLTPMLGPDFVGGNEKLRKSGLNVLNGATGAAILAHQSVLTRMSARNALTILSPGRLAPTEAFWISVMPSHERRRHRDFLPAAAHGSADDVVLFRQSDVVVAGDIIDTARFPVIDVANGGVGAKLMLNRLIELTVDAGFRLSITVSVLMYSRSRTRLAAVGRGGLTRFGGGRARRD